MGRNRKMKGPGRPQRIDGHDRFVHQWFVPSESDPNKTYKVSIDDEGNWLCSCPAFKFQRGPISQRKPCKHILKVQKGKEAARKAWATRRGMD